MAKTLMRPGEPINAGIANCSIDVMNVRIALEATEYPSNGSVTLRSTCVGVAPDVRAASS